ncbi:transcriptional regulator [Mesorhizobium loti]|uniref:XRE family transcriptional regulator n=1 Tax=Mesorhizobium erdmanii TaxID=1777866 RepID=A0A6M7UPU2_9HYPH|nr:MULTISPECIES: helix-turn-helix transcriptional regulator [Mesorhizobium]OBP72208.1 transcriptional regulator [Mesorhizobium loti]OBQ62433.1 transcriptional regulator [Mesorhizobium loti]QKC79185.1 XRE family transcriptional regulator [Mesorhizobium erdmanii]
MDLTEVMAINMRRLRHDQDLTQEELAARAELSMRYVGSIERARVSASVRVLGRLAKAFDVDPCELIRPPQ